MASKKIEGVLDFGYFIRQKYWGKGYTQRACELALTELSQIYDLTRLQVFIANENTTRLAIARKLKWLPLHKVTNVYGEQGHYFQLANIS